MEAKVSARSSKKSAGGSGTNSDRKKSRKKKKDKRKQSLQLLRGTESKDSDAVSPDCDSEVQAEGDNTQTDQGEEPGSTTPLRQVTKLPHLGSQSSVSLITQGVGASYSSAFAITSAAQATTTTASRVTPTVISTTTDDASRVAQSTGGAKRSSKSRSKGQSSKAGNTKSSKNKDRQGGGGGRTAGASTSTSTSTTTSTTPSASNSGGKVGPAGVSSGMNESLRWELVLEGTEEERERISVYKMNRRKRYLKAAQAKGLGWAVNYTAAAISPLSEDSGVDAGSHFVDFGTMQALRPMGAHRGLAEACVEC